MTKQKRYSQSEQAKLLADYEKSGLSKKAFCLQSGVAYSRFKNWSGRQKCNEKTSGDNFYRLKLTPPSTDANTERMCLLLPNGHRFEWSTTISVTALKNLLTALGIESC